MRPFDDIERIAKARVLDRPASPISSVVSRVLSNRRLSDVLHGVWLGHPLHPALAQVPIGSFVSSALLDLLPGHGRSADALIRVGLVSSLPAATSGLADWSDGHIEQQRVGLVHAGANTAALLAYVVSLRLRANGHRPAGVLAGFVGLALAGAGATLGGHMGYRQAMGANHAHDVPHIAPSDWTDIGPVDDLPAREPTQRLVGEVPVVVVRTGDAVHVLADTCTHAGAPLHEGELLEAGDPDGDRTLCLRCPWHQSVFRVEDGVVVHGPATAPQPRFDAQVVGGHVHARVRTWPGDPVA